MTKKKTDSTLADPVPQGLVYLVNDNDSVDVTLYWRYEQGKKRADSFAIFWSTNRAGKLTPADSSVKVAITSRSYTFHGLPHGRLYTFGIAPASGPTIGTIVQPSSSPDWTDVYSNASMMSGELKRAQEDMAKMRGQVGHIVSSFGALGKRLGLGLESLVRCLVKEFGKDFTHVDPLVLRDEEGQLFGERNAPVEFDLYAHSGSPVSGQ